MSEHDTTTRPSFLIDMDGVLVHEDDLIPGADRFIKALGEAELPFLVLTNNSILTPRDFAARLARTGIDLPSESIWTSALATAQFLDWQRPGGTAYVVGGETRTYSFEAITRAIRLIKAGARFIATNPDLTGPSPDGVLPATGSVASLVTAATGVKPYFVGKPNPLMVRSALNRIGAHSESTVMVGDRMDTDVVAGLEAGLETVLVLSGISTEADAERFAYRPSRIVASVADLEVDVGAGGLG